MTNAEQLIAEAERWIGITERGGDNLGPDVEAFQRAVDGRAEGEPWCMAFVQFCLKQIGGGDIFPSEHCLTVWRKSPRELRLQAPEPGCLMFWQYEGSAAGHVGIVKAVVGCYCITIEGNTGPGGAVEREGDGVYQKRRAIRPATGSMRVLGWMRCWA